ncbi:MAG: hypothetical protein A2750_04035 [Candidatus Yanofskybacteria bacterium RIFCSPHIGHO2_01_FULL_45_42]|uniref:Antitoxin Xre/MbcA/ParS-like toxin-binding domain-containing protein n=3 Tax=Candidatus Yanofskyibacteriota TaxID=1752733 RepID=A0A1F8F2D7_9BACT|nr:MAG: hypothetical protein A2750_04035 [Candidatus Yanofskybacteria bacterium RIFCSPHIGHO2_01_FULL_45_42]OGN16050.1 MAG: hypothetical protein A3C81_01915 [Candidatus Yanofskybacteria bacterium RIFCSPHIGHO2_02_FULL_46_19]OGN26175.1 MAG: hypothetical protein A3B17_02360 [Candidatus Yanofskybacteria bacterium RIFCSPLOWO2_01_FULL_45_72]OGN32146.1 MAG: hypothetical protein A3J01_00945 [Candidatus Yanofskybacteria bacterium RIFCSPLOWO2_02_FULL_45_18]
MKNKTTYSQLGKTLGLTDEEFFLLNSAITDNYDIDIPDGEREESIGFRCLNDLMAHIKLLCETVDLLKEVFPDEKIARWFKAKNQLFGGRIPLEIAETQEGAQKLKSFANWLAGHNLCS